MNQRIQTFLPYFLVLAISLLLCWYLFGDMLFHLSEFVLNGYGDGLKNNYAFTYHALYGKGIHFEGMNYPYGEHITYTDGQPLLLMLENQFGWVHSVQDGVFTINLLVVISLLVTPLILFRILRFYALPVWISVIGAVFIAFHASQMHRIISHYSLSYAFAIPLCYLHYLLYFRDRKVWRLIIIAITALVMGLLHPYFTLIFFLFGGSVLFVDIVRGTVLRQWNVPGLIFQAITFLIPFLTVYSFISFTDTIDDRIQVPFGSDYYITRLGHLFFPFKGYIAEFWKGLFGYKGHTEGDAYLGLALCITLLVVIIRWAISAIRGSERVTNLFHSRNWVVLSAIPVLLVAMGIHQDVLTPFMDGAINPALAQFRSLARLSWVFYIIITPWLMYHLWQLITHHVKMRNVQMAVWAIALLFMGADLHAKLQHIRKGMATYAVPVSPGQYPTLNTDDYQAIIALPYYHIGSEKVVLQYHGIFPQTVWVSLKTGLPIVNTMMSRTSIGQTYRQLQLIGSDKTTSVIQDLPSPKPLLLIVKREHPLSAGEQSLVSSGHLVKKTDDYDYYKFFPERVRNSIRNIPDVELNRTISSTNPYKRETITVLDSALHLSSDSITIELEHAFTNRIYGLPHVIIGNQQVDFDHQELDFRNGNIIARFKMLNPGHQPLHIEMKGLDIELKSVRIYSVG